MEDPRPDRGTNRPEGGYALVLKGLMAFVCVALITPAFAQCPNDNNYYTTPALACPGSTTATCMFGGEYVLVNVVAGNTYTFSTCGTATWDTQITLYNNAGGASLGYNDDGCGAQSTVTWVATFTGQLRVLVDEYPCLSNSLCADLNITCATTTPPASACSAVNIPSVPVSGQAASCHGANLITTANVTSLCGTASTLYLGGNEALHTLTPTTSGNHTITYTGQSYSSIWVFSGACPAAGGTCVGSVSGAGTTQTLTVNLTAGTPYWILFDTWPTPASPCPGTFSITSPSAPPPGCTNYILQVTGGSFPAEVSWALVGTTGVASSGNAPTTVSVCLEAGCFTMQMFDTFGDGWNGAAWSLFTTGGSLVQTGTLNSGSSGTATIPVGVPASNCGGSGPVTASDCPQAVNVCTNINFQIDPNGSGAVSEIPPLGSLGNPDLMAYDAVNSTWGTDNYGCLRNNEVNSTWMVVNIQTGGSLEFTFGGLGTQAGFYDWIMYPFNATTCGQISGNTVAPVRCNWNGVSTGGTGLASGIPAGGDPTNFEPPLMVNTGDRYIICFSNWSSVTTTVPLVFGGTAVVSCTPIILPVELVDLSANAQPTHIAVEWTTASESNTLRYELQRSPDALIWSTATELPAAGYSTDTRTTRWNDIDPLYGDNYYRLVVHDADGASSSSSPVHAFWNVERPVALPNPNDGRFRLTASAPDDVLGVVDATGRPVRFRLEGSTGALFLVLDKATDGLYNVRVAKGDVSLSIPVMITGR